MSRQVVISDVIEHLVNIKKKHGNLVCICSSDDEGNSYQKVLFTPTAMKVSGLETCYNIEIECDNVEATNIKPNAVCIN